MPACTICEKDVDDFKEVLPSVYRCPACGCYWEVIEEHQQEHLNKYNMHYYNIPWVQPNPPVPAEVDVKKDESKIKKTQKRLGWNLEQIKKDRGIE